MKDDIVLLIFLLILKQKHGCEVFPFNTIYNTDYNIKNKLSSLLDYVLCKLVIPVVLGDYFDTSTFDGF